MACLAGTSVFVVGVGLLAVAVERRPDRDKSPTPLWVRDTSVTLIALGYGIYVSAFAGWYLGRVTGAGVARACARWRDEQGSGAASP